MNEVGKWKKVGLIFVKDIHAEIWWILGYFVLWSSRISKDGFVLQVRLFPFVVG